MLLLPKFEYHEPQNIDDACLLLHQLKPDGKIIAGGTDVLVNLKTGKITPKALISIARLSGLSGIEQQGSKIWIGSQTIVSDLAENKLIRNKYPILSKAASTLGSPLIRNRATIGGNIVTARPAADLIPPLIALGATFELKCEEGTREVLLEEFLVGPGQTMIRENEILTRVILGEMPLLTGGDYIKLGHRKALEIAIVAVASIIILNQSKTIIQDAKVILSAVAPKAIHAVSAEQALRGEKPTRKLFEFAASRASEDCKPISDIRGGGEYRKEMVKVLTKRTLVNAFEEANRLK